MTELRVLDLGSHDGFLSLWLARQLKADGVDLHVDGVELNSDAVRIANDRLAAEGIAGRFVQGAAEDAPSLLEPGSYDVAVVFELVEHVPDVQRLLDAVALMVKADGDVYVSTPHGTFGTGNNPHHLRVYQAHDLADLLRRNGRLADLAVGTDGILMGRYRPNERKHGCEVALWLGPGWETWSPLDIETRGLGGSETAAVRLAVHLNRLGHIVTVYGECEPGVVGEVLYRHHSTFDPTDRRDVVIVSRIPALLDQPVNAERIMLWVHDVDCGTELTEERARKVDDVLVLSKFHQAHVRKTYPFVKGKLVRVRNGIHHDYFQDVAQEDRERVVLYTSSPDRGLDFLLDLWPDVRDQVPDAILRHAYVGVYDKVAAQNPAIQAHRRQLEKLSKQPGVEKLPALGQQQVAAEMGRAMVWAHPSWNTPGDQRFLESSCIGCVEAQAAGCQIVCSDWGALSETVQVGVRVGSRNGTGRPDRAAWVEALVAALEGDGADRAAREGPQAVASLGWEPVAKQVAARFPVPA